MTIFKSVGLGFKWSFRWYFGFLQSSSCGLKGIYFECWNTSWRFCQGYSKKIRILNIYAPYNNRLEFCEENFHFGILVGRSLIVAGDFNFMMLIDDVWGDERCDDPLSNFSYPSLKKWSWSILFLMWWFQHGLMDGVVALL